MHRDRPEGWIRVFAPATIANLGPGFDALGIALDGLGDVIGARPLDDRPGEVVISAITGEGEGITLEAARNCAGRAALEVLRRAAAKRRGGVEMTIHKGMPQGSGLGSSAASAVGGAVAANLLAGEPLDGDALLQAALEGEAVGSGARHADNLAPALFGGFTIVRSQTPVDVVRLPAPGDLRLIVVLPAMQIETRRARAVLPRTVALQDATANWANAAALAAGMARGSVSDIGRAVVDRVIEPVRRQLIPGFDDVKRAALEAGAHGCSISGAGPALFAVGTEPSAAPVSRAMQEAFRRHGLDSRCFTCAPDNRGARRID